MPASRQRALELLRMHQATARLDQSVGGYTVAYWKGTTCKHAKAVIPERVMNALIRDGLAEKRRRLATKAPFTAIVFVQITQAGRIGNGPVAPNRPAETRLPYVD